MPRDIRLSGVSLTKYGKRKKKIIELPLEKGLVGITTKGNKQLLLIGKESNVIERVIIYDVKNDTIECDFTTTIESWWQDYRKLAFSPNFSFVTANSNYFKYNPNTKTYDIITLNYYGVQLTKWLANSFICCHYDRIVEYNFNGEVIREIELPFSTSYLVDYENKIYFTQGWDNKIYEFDIQSFTYREIELPFNLYCINNIPIAKVKNTNYLHIFNYQDNKLYKLDLETLSLTVVKDFSDYDFVQSSFIECWFSNDGKILIMAFTDVYTENFCDMWFYNTENDKITRVSFAQYPFMVLEDKDTRKFFILDAPYGYISFVYDYLEDKVLGVIANYSWNPIYTDGELTLEL